MGCVVKSTAGWSPVHTSFCGRHRKDAWHTNCVPGANLGQGIPVYWWLEQGGAHRHMGDCVYQEMVDGSYGGDTRNIGTCKFSGYVNWYILF